MSVDFFINLIKEVKLVIYLKLAKFLKNLIIKNNNKNKNRYNVNYRLINILHDQLNLLISYAKVYIQKFIYIRSTIQ